MVFESLVTDLLNRFLGEYVENLDTKQLKIGIWGGDVVLKNLKLKQSALEDLDLPIQTSYGYLGKLILKIPWKNLYTAPVEVTIESLYLFAKPSKVVKYNVEKEEKAAIEAKKSELKRIQEAKKNKNTLDKLKTNKSFTEKLVMQIVNNLQVNISDIHIRYEDRDTSSIPFAFGITLKNFNINTTDENWTKCYMKEAIAKAFKMADLEGLAVYFNCSTESFDQYDGNNLTEKFRATIATKEVRPGNFQYIFGPITSQAKLKLNMSPDQDVPAFSVPKVQLYVNMMNFTLGVTRVQYKNIIELMESMDRSMKGAPYRKYRPYQTPVIGNAKIWWHFAYTCVVESQIKKRQKEWSWTHIIEHRNRCREYAHAYKTKMLTKQPTAQMIEACDKLEEKINLFNLLRIQDIIDLEVAKIVQVQEEAPKKSWFGSWFGGGGATQNVESDDTAIMAKFEAAMTNEEKAKLYQAIGYRENALPTELPEDYVAMTMHFELKMLEVVIRNEYLDMSQNNAVITDSLTITDPHRVILLQLRDVICDLQQRPSASAIKLNLVLNSLAIYGVQQGDILPVLYKSNTDTQYNHIVLDFETNPLDKLCDQKIKLTKKPSEIIYDGQTILQLLELFKPPKDLNISQIQDVAADKMSNVKERSATGLEYIISTHTRMDIDIELLPFYVIAPYKGMYLQDKHSALVVSLGTVKLRSKPRPPTTQDVHSMFMSGKDNEYILQEMMSQCYDVFQLNIDHVQILFTNPNDNWRDVILDGHLTEMHCLEPTSLSVSAHLCVIGDDPRLPKTKITGELPYIGISLSQARFLDMVSLFFSIPLPQNDEPPKPLEKTASFYQSTTSLASKLLDKSKQKMKGVTDQTGTDITDEIQQFTNLDVNFVIKEISIVLYQSKTVSTSTFSTPSEDYRTPVEESSQVSDSAERFHSGLLHEREKLFTFKVMQIEAALLQRTYDLKVALRLGGIALNQYWYKNRKEQIIDIISTPGYNNSDYLLTINYLNGSKESPEFISRYMSIEQLIEVNFFILIISLHQEAILDFLTMVDDFQRKLQTVMDSNSTGPRDRTASAADPFAIISLPTITEEEDDEDENAVVTTTKTKKKGKVVDSIKMKVLANMEQVSLKLISEKRPLTILHIQNLSAGVIMKTSYTELSVKLRDIIITDLNPSSIHSTILSVIGDDAINCTVILFNLDETSVYNSDDIKLEVSMGCMKFVFVNWFLQSVLNFLDHFQEAQKAIAEASAAAADAAKKNAVEAYTKATRINLNIRIKAPVIIVPIDSLSTDALCLDLGFIAITNHIFDVPTKSEHGAAVFDELKLELKRLKLSKVKIFDTDEINNSLSATDVAFGFRAGNRLLEPTSFALNINRNLSSGWYKERPEIEVSAKIESIIVNLLASDYKLMMEILNKNLTEGADERQIVAPPPIPKPPSSPAVTTSTTMTKIEQGKSIKSLQRQESGTPSTILSQSSESSQKQLNAVFKFAFQMDSLIINLFSDVDIGLATFGIYVLSLKGNKLVDETLNASVLLCDIQLDDIRPHRENKITRFMTRRKAKIIEIHTSDKLQPMIDITASIKDERIFAEVRVCSFDLIISVDYLMKIAGFLQPTLDEREEAAAIVKNIVDTKAAMEAKSSKTAVKPVEVTPPANANKKITLILNIAEPDIILVEQMDDINCHALILNCEVSLNIRHFGSDQVLKGGISNLNLHMCEFNPAKREATRHYILKPLSLSLNGIFPDSEEDGLQLMVELSDIDISISPGTIELLNRIMVTMTEKEGIEGKTNEVAKKDYSDLWKVQTFREKDFWFTQIEEADEAICVEVVPPVKRKSEVCSLSIPSFTVKIESGFGYYTIPMLRLDSNMFVKVHDWSSEMSIEGSLHLGMSYYNSSLALWEPLIEPNERENQNGVIETGPWELNFGLKMDNNKDEPDEEPNTTTMISVTSSDTLEVTVTKTCLEVLQNLGKSFSEAINRELASPHVIAPYVIQNDTGFDVSLNLKVGDFYLHTSHLPNQGSMPDLSNGIVFQTNTNDSNLSAENVTSVKISPGTCAYLQLKKIESHALSVSNKDISRQKEKFLHVEIGDIKKDLELPVYKADKRYFPLYRDTNKEPWGIISDVKVEYGSTIVTLHGVVQVYNHFAAPMSMYRYANNIQHFISVIPPNTLFNVPLHAIYAISKDWHFALPSYKPSIQGINWKDAPSDFEYRRNLQCDPIVNFEPFYINAVRTRTEVYHEVTTKYTMLSACYTIHLRPPVLLRNTLPIPIVISVAGCSVVRDTDKDSTEALSNPAKEIDKNISKDGEDFLDYGEKIVNPGELLHLPTVKLAAAHSESYSNIVVRLIQYLEKDWSCTTEIPAVPPEFAVWTFSSYDSVGEMSFELGVRYENKNGSLLMSIYCPFWMVNKTGLILSYRATDESVNILYHPPDYEGPILFSYREKNFFGKKKASIRVESGEWSDKIPLDVAGSSGVVTCKFKDVHYQIAVHNTLTKYSLTKQITFMPFFILVNKAPFAIEVQEAQRPADPWIKIESQQCVPLWPKTEANQMLKARCVEDDRSITSPFRYTEVQCCLLKLQNKYGGIYVDVHITEGGTFITFSEYYPGNAPAMIVNHTDLNICFWEKGNVNERKVEPNQKMMYTWSDPAGDRIIFWNNGKEKIEDDLQKDGVGTFQAAEHHPPIWWVSFLDGLQRVVLFTKSEASAMETQSAHRMDKITQEIMINIHGIGVSLVNNIKPCDVIYIGIASSGVIWEERKKARFKPMKIREVGLIEERYQEFLRDKIIGAELEKRYYMEAEKIEIDFKDMKIYKSSIRDIRRTFYPGLWFQLKTSPFQTQMHAKINRIQIDNQTPDCIFPVILAPVPLPKSVAASIELKPFMEASIVQRVIPYSDVKQFKYCTVLIQEFHIKVDLGFINELFEMLSSEDTEEEVVKEFSQELQRLKEPLSALVIVHSQQEQKNFYDQLHLGPLKVHVSFSMAGSETKNMPEILSTILQGVGVTLTDVNDVVFRLAFFERKYSFLTQRQLVSECVSHYTGQAVKQLYVLVLGLDVIGNPFGLVVGIKKGVEDLFYEPFQGAIQGPGEFAQGLVLGVRSLFGHTVGGAAGAVSKITGAVGKGLAALTFDKDYQKKRRDQINRKPANLQEGLARSGKGLVMGVVDGVTGVFSKPISGAKSEGVEGFFKGLGKGAVGLVARPTAGVIDFASGSFEAVKRATEMSEDILRLRPPRYFQSDGVVRPYSLKKAEGNKLLKEIDKGKYAETDTFIYSEVIIENRDIFVVSDRRVLYCVKNDLFGGWQVEWTHRWDEITTIKSTIQGVEICLVKDSKKVFGLFSSSDNKKVLLIPRQNRREELAVIMNDLKQNSTA